MALVFEPFALWLAQWERPELRGRPLVSAAKGRVRVQHLSPAARRAGITRGMALTGATAKVEGLEVVPAGTPHLKTAWEGLLGELYGYTPQLEPVTLGRVLLGLEPLEGRQLAESYGVRAGMAEEAEHALLGAFTAAEGQLREVSLEVCAKMPLYVLKGLGLSPASVTRLNWFGVTHLGQLTRWKRPQLRAFLGAEAARLEPLLYGSRKRQVARYRPPVTLCAHHDFDDPASEPHEVQPVLRHLADLLASQLDGKSARRLAVQVDAQGLTASGTRVAKEPLNDAGRIYRLAELSLRDTGVQALGLSSLTLELAGLTRPSRQGSLWKTNSRLLKAVEAVGERYPDALLKLEEVDPYALAFEHRFRLVRLSDGEEVGREVVAATDHRRAEPAGRPGPSDAEEALAERRARA